MHAGVDLATPGLGLREHTSFRVDWDVQYHVLGTPQRPVLNPNLMHSYATLPRIIKAQLEATWLEERTREMVTGMMCSKYYSSNHSDTVSLRLLLSM
jgi:hypothetical protein